MGYLIVIKQRILRSDVKKWTRNPNLDKTWLNVIDHFRQAHQKLNTDSTIEKLDFHSTDAIVEQIIDRLREEADLDPA